MERSFPQIKICGLTDAAEAEACAHSGADAIGLVFYPPSPRHVTPDQAGAIVARLPDHVVAVGVFVDPSMDELAHIVAHCGLTAVQLHGVESPEFIRRVKRRMAAKVIKALFTAKSPGLADAPRYDVAGYLVECGKGRLPGGNAEQWNWALAEPFGRQYPLVLAGGLGVDTVGRAIAVVPARRGGCQLRTGGCPRPKRSVQSPRLYRDGATDPHHLCETGKAGPGDFLRGGGLRRLASALMGC
jgi:phosphoribosylanthranilate isomerase